MSAHARDTIVDRLLRNARERPDAPAVYARDAAGDFRPLSWSAYATRCRAFAGALLAEGFAPGDAVTVLGENSVAWLVADLGAMMARGVAAGVYTTSTAEQAAYIIGHCDARVCVVEDAAQWRKVHDQRAHLPALRRIVLEREVEQVRSADPTALSFAEFLALGQAHQAEVDARLAALEPGDLATLIYTSGTTGPPKGVMLSHDNLAFTADIALNILGQASPDECVVSYLPLSHIAEQMFSIHLAISAVYPVWIAGGFDRLKDTLLAARPTIFMGVPRVWEKFAAALEGRLSEARGLKGAIVRWAMSVGERTRDAVVERGRPSGLDAARFALAERLFFRKLAAQLGLDRLKIAVSGAAPISRATLDFFARVGIVVHEVYGQSEGTGPTTFNRPTPGHRRLGTVGRPVPGVEVRLAPDGEIQARGRNIFLGYYKQPEATAEALIDGWLCSGDVGVFDADGYLQITDRKKDLIITAGGKNVAPQNLERMLKGIAGVSQAVVIGDRQPYLVALFTLDAERPASAQALQAGVDAVNAHLAQYETIKRFVVLPDDFSVEGGELTPTQKVKRKAVGEKYAAEIAALYAAGQ